ncbi:MAG TPA: glycosyltransferase [Gemmataceae bacterium]|nr:glycosyltransferase [Gemmataceae bacterium]
METHTQTLARVQADLGADVHVVVVNHATTGGRDATFEWLSRTRPAAETDGPVRVSRVGRWANFAKLDVSPGLAGVLRRIASDPPHVWHLHTPNVTMMLAVLACQRIRPLVITHHSDIVRQRVSRFAIRPLEHNLYRRAARILPTSPAYVEGSNLLQQFAERLTPIPLGLDLTPLREPSAAALRHAASFRERFSTPLWLCVGRLIYYKGLHVALAALRDVPGTLLVIGTGPLEADLRRQASALGVADRVAWHGTATAEELVGAYHAATALWFPSTARSEAFGLVQVEAMAAGCPVINTAIPGSGVPWVCRHEREALTCRANDAAEFGATAKRLLTEPGLRSRLVDGGRMRAAEFGHRRMAQRTLDVYEEVVCASCT